MEKKEIDRLSDKIMKVDGVTHSIYIDEAESFNRMEEILGKKALKVKMTMQVWQKLLTEDLMNMKKQKSLLDLAKSLI